MSNKSKKPLDNIKKICSDLGNLFEEMEKQEVQIQQASHKKQAQNTLVKEQTFSILKQQIAELS